MNLKTLDEMLQETARMHHHLCPRQVLGVRMGLLGGKILNIEVPQSGKRLLTIAETDGCAVDGISVATGCWVGRRTLRIEDYGKVAATFVDTQTKQAIRIVPQPAIRHKAKEHAPEKNGKWETQLIGYQRMPDDELLDVQEVSLLIPIEKIISRPGKKAICQGCGEEIINEREVESVGRVLCRSCAGEPYYILKRYPLDTKVAAICVF
ncbi:MAG: formylmethanofuran dehydrogenase [Ignavibacteriae bacterium]|nr:formylmethanofuran dehydrogenase [Ignavibacteriota bacterium]